MVIEKTMVFQYPISYYHIFCKISDPAMANMSILLILVSYYLFLSFLLKNQLYLVSVKCVVSVQWQKDAIFFLF